VGSRGVFDEVSRCLFAINLAYVVVFAYLSTEVVAFWSVKVIVYFLVWALFMS